MKSNPDVLSRAASPSIGNAKPGQAPQTTERHFARLPASPFCGQLPDWIDART